MDAGDDDVDSIVEAIRRYVAAHPAAGDSLEGVRRWWLPTAFGTCAPSVVERALERSVAEGVVVCSLLPDGRTLYAARRV